MPSENVRSRVRRGVLETLWNLELSGFDVENMVFRKHGATDNLKSPAIVVTKGRVIRQKSPAGMRIRTFEVPLAVYFKLDGTDIPDREDQEFILEQIQAAFDLPQQMPESLTGVVPEAQECRATNRDEFLETTIPYKADVHRMVIEVEVCQLAGVA